MVDPTQPPPSSFSPIGQPLKAGSSAGNVISHIPQAILSLPTGSILTGLLTAKEPQTPGGFTFQTPQGTLSLITKLPLEVGNKLTLEVLGRGTEFHAKLITVDGKAPPPGPKDTILRASSSPLAPESGDSTKVVKEGALASPLKASGAEDDAHIFRLSQQLTKQIASSSSAAAGAPAGHSDKATKVQTHEGASAPRVIPAVLLTPEPKGISQIITTHPALLTPTPAAASFVPTPTTIAPTHIGAGSIIQLAVQKVEIPPHLVKNSSETLGNIPKMATDASTPLIKGVVVGVEKSGETVVNTQIGTIKLTLDRPLPQSTEITFVPVSITPYNPVPEGRQTATHDALGKLLTHWKTLEDTSQTIKQALPQTVQEAFTKALPNADHQLGSRLLQFIQMIKQEAPEKFFPREAIEHLKAKEPELLQQLRQDIGHIRQAFTEESHKLWQMLLFPIFDGKELHQAQFYLHDYYEDDQQEGEPDGTRFVVELSTKQFGAMQFDGLVHKAGHKTAFDLVIRTHDALPEEVRSDIRGIFIGALEDSNLEGSLAFQRVPAFPVHPSQEFFGQETRGGLPEDGSILV